MHRVEPLQQRGLGRHSGRERVSFSSPVSAGSGVVADGAVSLTVPESVPFGEHRFAPYAADGEVVVLDSVTVVDPAGPGGGSGSGDLLVVARVLRVARSRRLVAMDRGCCCGSLLGLRLRLRLPG